MSFLRKIRNARNPENKDSRTNANAYEKIGGIAMQATTESDEDKPRSFSEEIRDRVHDLRSRKCDFVYTALQNGASSKELPGMIADAMNNGSYPRVVETFTVRMYFALYLLDGVVPADAIAVHTIGRDLDGNEYALNEPGVHVSFDDAKRDTSAFPTLTAVFLDRLPKADIGEPLDVETLSAIDAHMQTRAQDLS